MRFISRGRRPAIAHQRTHGFNSANGERAQFCIDSDNATPPRLAIKERAFINGLLQHELKAQRLSTKLNLVGAVRFRLAALVFDGISALGTLRFKPMKFHHICHAGNA